MPQTQAKRLAALEHQANDLGRGREPPYFEGRDLGRALGRWKSLRLSDECQTDSQLSVLTNIAGFGYHGAFNRGTTERHNEGRSEHPQGRAFGRVLSNAAVFEVQELVPDHFTDRLTLAAASCQRNSRVGQNVASRRCPALVQAGAPRRGRGTGVSSC